MKKSIIIIVLTFFYCQSYCQSFNFGLGAGVSYCTLIAENFNNMTPNYKAGYQINTIFGYNFNDKIGIRIEPGVANRGTTYKYSNIPSNNINIYYITTPILAKYTVLNNFSILLGPEFAYRMDAQSNYNNSSTDVSYIYDSKIDIGVNTGVSYCFGKKIDIGLRYNRGFISTIKDLTMIDEFGNEKGKVKLCNQGSTLTLMYLFK